MSQFLSFQGRINRMTYFLRMLLIAAPTVVLSMAFEREDDVVALIAIGGAVLSTFQVVRRLHDINLSGYYWFVFLIPFANIIFGLYILFKAGDATENVYGPPPAEYREMIKD